jgi:hypothetical protein
MCKTGRALLKQKDNAVQELTFLSPDYFGASRTKINCGEPRLELRLLRNPVSGCAGF